MNKIQFGEMITGDFSENTITFEISKDSKMVLQAGKYAIVPIDEFNKLSELANKLNTSDSKFAISDVSNNEERVAVCPKCKSKNIHSIMNGEYSCFYCGNKFKLAD